jgi:catechol 2,3-dioxygenase-like lactoylglutathione lyase family enzyme
MNNMITESPSSTSTWPMRPSASSICEPGVLGGPIEGEWMDKVVGLDDGRAELVIVKTPDGSGKLELTKFHTPADEEGACPAPANRLGIRHIAFVVHDMDTIVNGLRAKGLELIGEIQNYEDTFRLCYIRGLEGLIVELAEQIGPEQTDYVRLTLRKRILARNGGPAGRYAKCCYCPTRPSMHSRRRSACPQCRAYSSIR